MKRVTGIFIALSFAALSWPDPAYSQDIKSQETRKARLQKEIAILDEQIESNSAQSASAISRLTLIQGKVASRQRLISESEKEISPPSAHDWTRSQSIMRGLFVQLM